MLNIDFVVAHVDQLVNFPCQVRSSFKIQDSIYNVPIEMDM